MHPAYLRGCEGIRLMDGHARASEGISRSYVSRVFVSRVLGPTRTWLSRLIVSVPRTPRTET